MQNKEELEKMPNKSTQFHFLEKLLKNSNPRFINTHKIIKAAVAINIDLSR